MSGKVDLLEALARATDLLLGSVDPAEMAARFLKHAVDVFHADAGVLHLATETEAPVVHNTGGADAARLASAALASLKQARRRCRRWATPETFALGVAWGHVVAACPGRDDVEPVLVLGYHDSPPADGPGTRLLQLMVRNAAFALENAWLHVRTLHQAERLAVQTEELERIRQALERHSREMERNLALRSRFFAAMSHELRTPINAILGYSQLLQQGAFEPLLPAQREVAGRIGASAQNLLGLVNDVLDFSKIDAGKIEVRLTTVHLDRLVMEATAAIEASARLKGLELHVDAPDDLQALDTDPDRVRQILLNLLGNAVKFTHSGSIHVQIRRDPGPPSALRSASGRPGSERWIAVSVRDTGIGIPPDKIDAIFGEFVQLVDPNSGRTQGTGLGLAISSRLARILGGELTVESELGATTTFTLYLPCPEPSIENAPANR